MFDSNIATKANANCHFQNYYWNDVQPGEKNSYKTTRNNYEVVKFLLTPRLS